MVAIVYGSDIFDFVCALQLDSPTTASNKSFQFMVVITQKLDLLFLTDRLSNKAFGHENFRNLNGVGRCAFAKVVAHNPHVEATIGSEVAT